MLQFFLSHPTSHGLTQQLIAGLNPSVIPALHTEYRSYLLTSLLLITASLLCVVYAWLMYREKPRFIKKLYEVEHEEYDFMSSRASFHSQLDIASAYIDMQLFAEARHIIKDLSSQVNRDSNLANHLQKVTAKLKKSMIIAEGQKGL